MADQTATGAANSREAIKQRIAAGRIGWAAPLIVLMSRSFFLILAQALVAGIYLWRGNPAPWNAAAPWWSVYGTLADLGCLSLMFLFTHREGIRLRDLIGRIRLRFGRDLFLGLGCLAVMFVAVMVPGPIICNWIYGTPYPPMYPGLLAARSLPAWGVIYSFIVWPLIWSPTEEMTYQAFALARLDALFKQRWIAVALVAFWWALQHSFLPLILDWHYVLWRFLYFFPGVAAFALIYLWLRRLAPLILGHWPMDLTAVFYTLKF